MKKSATFLIAVIATAGLFFGCNGKSSKADNSLSELKGRGVFVLGLDDSFPPLGFRDENNEITGYDIDLAKEVSKRLGVTFKAQPINWDAKEQELSTGNIDCIWNGLTITEERKAILSFTKPYLNNAQIVVVRNDSGINSLADLKGKKIGLQEEDFVILYVGRLIQVKGILELIKSVLSINDNNIKLLVVGSANFGKRAFSPYAKKVKKLCKKNRNRIIATGYVDNSEIYKYAMAADIQCVPSLWEEAAGLVTIEAMVYGIPTIVTNSGGMTEYVTEENALIIERDGIAENLKNAICYLKDNPELRNQMSKSAKIQSKKYGEETYYKNFVKTVYEIIEENAIGGQQ